MMKSKNVSILTALAFAAIGVVVSVQASQDSSHNVADLKAQLKSNEKQISELKKKIENLEARLGNVEIGLGKTQSELEWKVQPLASEIQ
ncbi:hypothetical protein ACJJI3_07475 [Microbulbifer sp. ZKSA004]|uniref:hypothetical protein n=1 Tax=Microbulbifer sp. ZKSA004 TaxID=3243389 RepID=UPI0040395666